ncbi:MAG: PIG-L deacetylase family protein, partial [Phototrophicaceae bacterium]
MQQRMTLMNDTLPPQARKVMGIFAHPDDAEFFAGATFARWAAEGADVRFVIATSGDKGSDDPQMTS